MTYNLSPKRIPHMNSEAEFHPLFDKIDLINIYHSMHGPTYHEFSKLALRSPAHGWHSQCNEYTNN